MHTHTSQTCRQEDTKEVGDNYVKNSQNIEYFSFIFVAIKNIAS